MLFQEYSIKNFFHRKRPKTSGKTKGLSFPSSHAFASGFAIVISLAFSFPYSIAIIIFSLLNALNRIIIGVHYVFDVLVGLSLGFLAGGLWYLLLNLETVEAILP